MMKGIRTVMPAAVAASVTLAVGVVPATATAADATPAAATSAVAGGCPAVQMIAVNDVADSSLGESDTGFLSQVAAPVLAAANGDNAVNENAGFSAPSTTPTPVAVGLPSQVDDWKPDVWGTATAMATPTQDGGDVWGEPETTTGVAGDPVEVTPEETTPATTPKASVAGAVGVPQVGRTIVSVKSTNDTRAYLPGVTGPDNIPNYEESINTAIADTKAVLSDIDARCPSTKVVLLGVGQGAQAASAVSKEIGAGEVFDSSKVLGVSLFADPTREEDQPVVASGASAPAGASGSWDVRTAPGAGIATVRGDTAGVPSGGYGQVADRTVSWCATGDTSCAIPKEAPLRTLVSNTTTAVAGKAPEVALQNVADTLAPAVALGTVESLAQDVDFGPDGFSFKRAQDADETLIGRIAHDSGRRIAPDEFQDRLLTAGMSLGGMALAAGATVVKEVIKPENIAQIAAASAISPAAGAGAALLIAGGAAIKLISPATVTTGAARLADEAKAAGVDDEGVADAAVMAAVGTQVSKQQGTYDTVAATESGQSPATATTDWLLGVVGGVLGRDLGASTPSTPAVFDASAVQAAVKAV